MKSDRQMDCEALASELMHGAYDLHLHSSPSVFPREIDGMELVREADAAGMAGVMLKSHYEPTALRAALINKYSGCTTAKALGALVLNWPVGGLNVYAVEEAVKAGAKIIWMPTRDAANSLDFGNMDGDFFNRPGISPVGDDGKLKKEVYAIMEVVKRAGVYLATGHIRPAESVLLCQEGRKQGVNMILTHPEFPRTLVAPEVQAELGALGVLIEHNWLNVAMGSISIEDMAAHIRQAGVENSFISTDRGQKGFPSPVKELKVFIQELLKQGFTEEELDILVRKNPAAVAESRPAK